MLQVLTAHNRSRASGLIKHRASSLCKAIRSCGWCGWCAWVYSWFFAFRILKINSLFIPWNYTMQKRLPFVSSEQNVTSIFALFHLPVDFILCRASKLSDMFCDFPFARLLTQVVPIYRSSESFPSLVADWEQLVDYRPIARGVAFVFANHLRLTTLAILHLRIFWRFFMFFVCTIVYTYLAMEHVHHKLLEVIGKIQQQFSSNEIKWLMLPANDLCSV